MAPTFDGWTRAAGCWLLRAIGVGLTLVPLAGSNALGAGRGGPVIQYLRPLGEFTIRNSVQGASPAFYSAIGKRPGWKIAQWNIAGGQLSPFEATRKGDAEVYTAMSREDRVTVTRTGRGTSIELMQNGRGPCNSSAGKPRESDLFFSPRDRAASTPTALRLQPLPLQGLKNVVIRATVSVRFRPAGKVVCGINMGGATIALILNDLYTAPPETLFYQIALNQPCGADATAFARTCRAISRVMNYFHKKTPFGVDDRLPLYGGRFLSNGETRALSLNVLGRLEHAISAGPPAMDHDPSHWVLASTYMGQAVFGSYVMSSSWSRVGISVQLK